MDFKMCPRGRPRGQGRPRELHLWSSPEVEYYFPRIQVQTCAQMHTRVNFLEGMQMKTIPKLLGGIHSNYWGDISPIPQGFGTPV